MSVWKSDEKLLIFVSLISPSKIIFLEKKYQAFDSVFHQQMKHLEVHQKYSATRRIFNSLLSVSSGDETLRLMIDILQEKSLILFPYSSIVCHIVKEQKLTLVDARHENINWKTFECNRRSKTFSYINAMDIYISQTRFDFS